MSSDAIMLRVLGAAELEGAGGTSAHSILAHPKRVAVLAYLALARPAGFQRRDALVAMLWPDADQERARSSLRQAVHHIRRVLGPEAVRSRGDEDLALGGTVACDASEFERALAAGDPARALSLYRGDLLPAFFISDCPEFERWLETERARLRGSAVRSAWSLADRSLTAGDTAAAGRWATWAAGLEPLDEAVQRRLIMLLERAGDRAAALRAYDTFRARLRSELESEPEAQTEALIAELRARTPPIATAPPAVSAVAGGSPAHRAPPDGRTSAPAPSARRRWWPVAATLAILVLVTVWARTQAGRRSQALDPELVVVVPFRVASADTSLQFLGEGLVDMLSAKLIGAGGPRAADPRAVLAAWRSASARGDDAAALAVGRALGAGRAVLGAVIGARERLVITASLVAVKDGARSRDASVTGPMDSLPALIEQLALRLLSGEIGSGIGGGTTASLEALREYLRGRSAFRHANYDEALGHLQVATALDSSFALAALELSYASDWAVGPTTPEGRDLAWRLRAGLAPRDRAFLRAVLGPDYPGKSSITRRIDAWEQAARLAADRPEIWYGLGDLLLHYGALYGRDSGFSRAEAAFARAVALDSGYSAPLEHLVQIAAQRGDLAAVRRLAALAHRADSTSDAARFLDWRVAVALGDSGAARRIESGLDSLPLQALRRIAEWGVLEGVHVDVARRAARLFLRRATTSTEQEYAERLAMLVAEDAGHFTERDSVRSAMLRRSRAALASPIASAYSDLELNDGDPERLARIVPGAEARSATRPRGGSWLDAAALFLWYAGRPDAESAARADGYLDRAIAARPEANQLRHLVAIRAIRRHEPEAERLLAAMDAVRSATEEPDQREQRSLELARLLAQDGDTARALSLLRNWAFEPATGLRFLPARLRLLGRLAAAAGDTAEAVRAYRQYLALRHDPDPGARLWADSVRLSLAHLERRSVP